jgi:hypothetical protein
MKGGARHGTAGFWRVAFLALIPFGLALLFWKLHPNLVWDADSASYVGGWPMRTATYHLFLKLFYGPMLLPMQLLLFAAALSWLAIQSSRSLPWLACAAMLAAIAGNPYVWELQASVMSEALTTPLLTIVVGCILGFVTTRRPAALILAALLCGLMTTIRPSLLLFILTPLCALWAGLKIPGRVNVTAVILAVWLAPVIAERLYSKVVHGSELTSPVGRNIFMKGAIIDAPPTALASPDALDRRLLAAVNRDYEPVRQLIDRTNDRDVRYILMSNYEACAGYPCGDSFVNGFHVSEAELERHMLRVGIARLRSNPVAYLELAASEYQRMFLLHPRKHPDLAPKYNAFLARESPIPYQSFLGEQGQPTPPDQQQPLLRFNRATFALIGILAALMTVGFAFWRPNRRAEAAFALLVGTQAVLLFTTLLGVGQPRYAMGMWPSLIAGELLGLLALLGLRRRSGSAAVRP